MYFIPFFPNATYLEKNNAKFQIYWKDSSLFFKNRKLGNDLKSDLYWTDDWFYT